MVLTHEARQSPGSVIDRLHGEARHLVPVESARRVVAEGEQAVQAALQRAAEGIEGYTLQGALQDACAAIVEEGACAAHVAVGEVSEADRDLDQALERLSIAALGAQPVRLQQLVHLEVEVRMEEEGCRDESGGEGRIGRIERTLVEDPSRALRPLEQLARVLPVAARDVPATLAALEHVLGEGFGQRPRALEGVRIAADFDHRREGLAGARVVERVEDQLGQAIPERPTACPKDSGPPSMLTTLIWRAIFPMVCPHSQWKKMP